jgi:hypothetical protein
MGLNIFRRQFPKLGTSSSRHPRIRSQDLEDHVVISLPMMLHLLRKETVATGQGKINISVANYPRPANSCFQLEPAVDKGVLTTSLYENATRQVVPLTLLRCVPDRFSKV